MKLPTSSHNTLTSRSISVSPSHKLVSLRHRTIISCCSCKEDLKGQTVAVVGLGVSGRSAAKLALTRGASVIAIDSNENLVPLERDSALEKHGYLKTVLGSCDRELLESADRVVVSPGVSIENYGISSLLQSGRRVMSELDFAAEVLPKRIKILAVTGTNGKSTVSTFAGQMLCQLGIKAFVGGNLGNPLSEAAIQCLASPSVNPDFQCVDKIDSDPFVAISGRSGGGEQLSDGNTERAFLSLCKVAVILNLTQDHLERHKTMKNYAATKSRIFSHMSFSKLAILPVGNQHLNIALKDYEDNCNVAWIGSFPGIKLDMERRIADFKHPSTGIISRLHLGTLKAIGSHNLYNAAVAAFSVLKLDVEVDIDSINSAIALLKPPPHRMQIVRKDAQGVTWVDDSKATNVEAAYTGISALKEQKSVVLLGGVAKVLNAEGEIGFEQLLEPLEYHRCIITFGSSGMMIQKTLQAAGLHIPCFRVKTLEEAVNYARSKATSGDAIVLCPGCASFDEFRNFEHRGKVFQELAFALP